MLTWLAAGQPLTEDIHGNPRIQNGTVDIGAIEGATTPPAAQVYVVTSLADVVDGEDGELTFREAFEAAQRNQPVGDAPAGSFGEKDVIRFADGLTGTILVDAGEVVISSRLRIEGPGAEILAFDADGNNRVFLIEPSASVDLSGITVSGGSADLGGGIYNLGRLSIASSTISGNSATGASGAGGGIYSTNTLKVIDSTISNNSGGQYGGGIYSDNSSTTASILNSIIAGNTAVMHGGGIYNNSILSVTDSTISQNASTASSAFGGGIANFAAATIISTTISGNSAGQYGGGVYNSGSSATASILNSTISGNTAVMHGGGIYNNSILAVTDSTIFQNSSTASSAFGGGIANFGPATIISSTISGNSVGRDGAGVYSSGSSSTLTITNSTVAVNSANNLGGGVFLGTSASPTVLHNTVVAGNVGLNNSQAHGTVASGSSHNLIGLSLGLSGITNGVNGNQIGVESPIDPMLGPLQDNGGPTWTHAPLPGSPLIDAGNDAKALDAKGNPLLTDQRGFLRLYGIVDIGAVEAQPPGVPIAEDDGYTVAQDGVITLDVLANDFCNNGSPMGTVIASWPSHGDLEVNPDGTCTYTPEPGFWGSDVFSYHATNGDLLSNTATVVISVLLPTSIVVTTADDEMDGDLSPGDISLREALAMAVPGSTIQFAGSLVNQVIRLTYPQTATLAIADVQIVGLGDSFLTINGIERGTVFQTVGGNSYLSHMTITGGTSSGIVLNPGTGLSLDRVVVSGNRASSGGGVCNNGGTLTVMNSAITRNTATGPGGGVYNLTGTLTVTNSVIDGNTASGSGGGIMNSGTLTVTKSTISGNSTTGTYGQGGGICNTGVLTVTNSTVSINSALENSGGIHNTGRSTITESTISGNSTTRTSGHETFGRGGGIGSTGILSVTASTISGNSAAQHGGGIYGGAGTINIVNSTISGNSASQFAGGVLILGVSTNASIVNSTITANTSTREGGGMYANQAKVTLFNSVVAANFAAGNTQIQGAIRPESSHNLIGFAAGMSVIRDGMNGNRVGVQSPLDPMLGPLQDNGGPTWTHAPLPGSPLIDAGCALHALDASGKPLLFEQRGLSRLYEAVDIGAVEVQPAGVPIACNEAFVIDQGGSITFDILANDFFDDQSSIETGIVNLPSHGSLEPNPDGTWTYTPDVDFWGTDEFSYQLANGELLSNTARVCVSVLSPTSIVVTTVDDEHDGDLSEDDVSLREALSMATPGSTIQFSAAMLNQVIKLTYSSTATLSIADVQIIGLGASFLTIDGNARGAVFQATGGESLISHLTVTGGSNSGIIVDANALLSLDHVAVDANRSATQGGGILNNGSLVVTKSTISRNTTGRYGGGIYNGDGTLAASDSVIFGNTVNPSSLSVSGGGIYNAQGTVDVTNSIVAYNAITGGSGSKGGGVGNHSGTLRVDGSTIVGNSSSSEGGGGIGTYGPDGMTSITNSSISRNWARNGGGIDASGGTLSVTNSIVSGNIALEEGGGFADVPGNNPGTLRITNSTIAGNSAGQYGGGLSFRTKAVIISNSIVTWNSARCEPNIAICPTALTYESLHNLIGVDPSFVRNPGPGDDGVWGTSDDDSGDLRLRESSPAVDMGCGEALPEGVIRDLAGNPRIVGDRVDIGPWEFQGETPPGREAPSVVVTTLDDIFDPYDGQTSLREALFHAGQNTVETTITFDVALDGGAIVLNGQPLYIDRPAKIDASALGSMTIDANGRSTVLTCLAAQEVELIGLKVTGGRAPSGGGIINLGTLTVNSMSIIGNVAVGLDAGRGGGIHNCGALTIVNSIISGNLTDSSPGYIASGGGGVFTFGPVLIVNSTVAGNISAGIGSRGGGIHAPSGAVVSKNSIITLNTAPTSSNVYGSLASGSSYNLVGGDPGFVRNPSPGDDGVWGTTDDDFGDLRLRIDSPAINAGSNTLAVDAQGNPLTVDLDGNPRVSGPSVDIGAHEYQFPRLPGDADWSGTVDEADAKILASNWGKSGMTWADGDFNNDGIVNAIDAAILAAHFGMTLPPPGEATPSEPLVPVEPIVADMTPFVGPLPIGNLPSARQPIQPVQRTAGFGTQQRAYALHAVDLRSPEELLIETMFESSAAALDTALAEEYGPAIEQPSLLNRHAGWSSMVARRQSNRRDGGDLGRAELAVDLLMARR